MVQFLCRVPNADDFYTELVNINDVMRCDIHHWLLSKFQTICAEERTDVIIFHFADEITTEIFYNVSRLFLLQNFHTGSRAERNN